MRSCPTLSPVKDDRVEIDDDEMNDESDDEIVSYIVRSISNFAIDSISSAIGFEVSERTIRSISWGIKCAIFTCNVAQKRFVTPGSILYQRNAKFESEILHQIKVKQYPVGIENQII